MSHLLLGLTVLPLTWLLLNVCCHGEGCTIMAVSQVDDVGDRGQHGSLGAGANDCVPFTHCQQQLKGTCKAQNRRVRDITGAKVTYTICNSLLYQTLNRLVYLYALFDPEVAAHGFPVLRAAHVEQPLIDAPLHGGIKYIKELCSDQWLSAAKP